MAWDITVGISVNQKLRKALSELSPQKDRVVYRHRLVRL